MRPVITPAALLWRDEQTLQVGTAGGRVLAGVDPQVRAVLQLLDGTRDVPRLVGDAGRAGCAPVLVRHVLDLLDEGGLLTDADSRWPSGVHGDDRARLSGELATLGLLGGGDPMPALFARDRAQVLVLGAGAVGATLAGLLAASGVGTVDALDEGPTRWSDTAPGGLRGQDVGRERGLAAREHVQRLVPSAGTGPATDPDLVVLAPTGRPDEATVARLVRGGTPHLLVAAGETVGVVGPLVVPGRSACLDCLDHSRTDRDPHWPMLATQLAAARRHSGCAHALAATVAAQAALQVLAVLDGTDTPTVDGTLELALPDWRWRRRSWPRHAACACASPQPV